jgi:hypothetical protein
MVKRSRCWARRRQSPCNRDAPARVIACTLRPNTYLILVLALGLAGTSTLAWQHWQELVALRATSQAARDAGTALEARLADFRKRNLDLQAQLAAVRLASADAEAASADVKDKAVKDAATLVAVAGGARDAVGADGAPKKDDQLELLAALADMPEFQKLLALQQGGQVDTRYAALFKKLHLSPEETLRLESLLTEKQNAVADVMLAVHDQGLTGKDASAVTNQLLRAENQQINASIKDLLGPQRFGQYQTYEQTQPQRQTVDQLAQRLSYTNTPLTPAQSDRLVQVLASNATIKTVDPTTGQTVTVRPSTNPLPGSLTGLGIPSNNYAPITNTAVAKAESFLAPQQTAALAQMQQAQQAQQTINALVRGGSKPAAPAASPPPPPPIAKPPGK